jgi:hypothetical protein
MNVQVVRYIGQAAHMHEAAGGVVAHTAGAILVMREEE